MAIGSSCSALSTTLLAISIAAPMTECKQSSCSALVKPSSTPLVPKNVRQRSRAGNPVLDTSGCACESGSDDLAKQIGELRVSHQMWISETRVIVDVQRPHDVRGFDDQLDRLRSLFRIDDSLASGTWAPFEAVDRNESHRWRDTGYKRRRSIHDVEHNSV